MRDILYTAATSEPREALIARLSKPTGLIWKIAPKSVIRRMYLVHHSEIIGWLTVEDQLDIGDEPVMTRRHDTGEIEALRHTKRLLTFGPIKLLSTRVPCCGFRGFRYFDPSEIDHSEICKPLALAT